MSDIVAEPAPPAGDEIPPGHLQKQSDGRELRRELLRLALPVLAEHLLHIGVGINDTYLANHLSRSAPAATAAVGTVSYIFWFLGLFAGAIGAGSTAIIAREIGARHRRRANSVCGQSMLFAALLGCASAALLFGLARPIARFSGLEGTAFDYTLSYLRMLTPSVPFLIAMFVANACLRAAGDTLTPAVAMIVVDIVNIVFTWGFTLGMFGLPALGFNGIAIGTVIAYVTGGVLQISVLLIGRGGIKLHLHRLRPHVRDMRRILRIGIPGAMPDLINWVANFALIKVVNRTHPLDISAAAHTNTVRIESLSFMTGFAVSIAVATLVGQSLGMKDPKRAQRAAYLGYAFGGGFMTLMGILFVCFAEYPANLLATDPQVRALTAQCLRITGFCQTGFAAAIVFGGALRGAGDTLAVMYLTTGTILALRMGGVILVGSVLHKPLPYIWMILATDLFVRGILIYGRFLHGGWKRIKV